MLAWIVDIVLRLAMIAIVVRVVLRLIGVPMSYGYGKILADITEPMLRPFRDRLGVRGLNVDFSPVLAILALIVARWLLIRLVNG